MSDTTRIPQTNAYPARRPDATICLELSWINRYCGPNRSAANDPLPDCPAKNKP